MKKLFLFILAILFYPILLFNQNQMLEFGDAPEGAIAYPRQGVTGMFPTCVTVGPATWIQHTNFGAYFSPAFDMEIDGNGGLCPQFAPYDNDECYNDGDAGLVMPQPYTISSLVPLVILCPNSQGSSLGLTCTPAVWGQNVDIRVVNNMPNMTTGYVNVLFDWDLNGFWAGAAPCPPGPAPEHVLVNFPVPNGFNGLLSALGPPPFLIGPNRGFIWARFSITERPVTLPWVGDGAFEDGETEDYLIYAGGYDFGDAPENALAYPATGVAGNFPTCQNVGAPASFVRHASGIAFLGPMVDGENDGNASLCPVFSPNQYDRDECFLDGDAGLMMPSAYTIMGNQVVPCIVGANSSLDTLCRTATWGTDIDINVNGPGFMNVLMDWNQDGNWANNAASVCLGAVVPEHVLVDFLVPAGYSGPLSGLTPPAFTVGPNAGYVWSRFTVSDVPVNTSNWDGRGDFMDGETEDYLLEVAAPIIGVKDAGDGLGVIPFIIRPNPAQDAVQIEFAMLEPDHLRIGLFGVDGQLLKVLWDAQTPKGTQTIHVSLPADQFSSGLYLVKLETTSGASAYRKLILQR